MGTSGHVLRRCASKSQLWRENVGRQKMMKNKQPSCESSNRRLSRFFVLRSRTYCLSYRAIMFWALCTFLFFIVGACVRVTIYNNFLLGLPFFAIFVICSTFVFHIGRHFLERNGDEPYIGGFLGICSLFAIGLIRSCTR